VQFLCFLGLLLTRFSLKGCERKKIWMNPGGKKKSIPSNDIYKPPLAGIIYREFLRSLPVLPKKKSIKEAIS